MTIEEREARLEELSGYFLSYLKEHNYCVKASIGRDYLVGTYCASIEFANAAMFDVVADNGLTYTSDGYIKKLEITTNGPVEQKTPDELERTYSYPDGSKVRIEYVVSYGVNPSGAHVMMDKNGVVHAVPKGWNHLEIKDSKWLKT